MASEEKKEMKNEYNLDKTVIPRSDGIEMNNVLRKQISKTQEAMAS